MWLLTKTAWRNLFRQRRRTAITVTAMAVSLLMAIPTYGLVEGLTKEMLRGITRMELGHLQIHDPAYPKGRALQSTLRRPDRLLKVIRSTPGVVAAAPRVHGYALASHDVHLQVVLQALPGVTARKIQFGRDLDKRARWRTDRALACEALVPQEVAGRHAVVVGTVLTPKAAKPGSFCERIRVVGLLKQPLKGQTDVLVLTVGLAAEDLTKAFGKAVVDTQAVLRHAAPIQLEGVDPAHERRITFMAKKVQSGSYLGPEARREMVVGYRLARVMRLKIGSKLFVQAGSLDMTSGGFYQDFTVVGIYKTGVDMIDRSRVFLHYRDAQKVMSLGDRVHEIVAIGTDANNPGPVTEAVRKRVTRIRLTVTTQPTGRRAGSRPLPAPITVVEPAGDDVQLLIPYDLKRRFDDLKGLEAVAKRVYGKTRVKPATTVKVSIHRVTSEGFKVWGAPEAPTDPCAIYLPQGATAHWAKGWQKGQKLRLASSFGEDGEACFFLRFAGFYANSKKLAEIGGGKSRQVIAVIPQKKAGDDEDELDLPAGEVTLVQPGPARPLRLVGVEPGLEKALSGLHKRLARGTYFPQAKGDGDDDRWPVLLSERAARRLSVGPGASLLLQTRDADKKRSWHLARVVGLLKDGAWSRDLPELVLPYYPAQQVDAARLNARAHEMVLLPKPGVQPGKLAGAASSSLAPLVRSWKQIAPDMAKLIKTQEVWTGIMLFIIFALAAMTVMNTMLMAVFERTREFGVLKSIGMRPRQVFGLIVLETLAMAVFTVIVGGVGGFLLNHWLTVDGIDLTSFSSGFTYQGTFINPVWYAATTLKAIFLPIILVSLVCLLVSFYPALRAGRLKPVEALRHHG